MPCRCVTCKSPHICKLKNPWQHNFQIYLNFFPNKVFQGFWPWSRLLSPPWDIHIRAEAMPVPSGNGLYEVKEVTFEPTWSSSLVTPWAPAFIPLVKSQRVLSTVNPDSFLLKPRHCTPMKSTLPRLTSKVHQDHPHPMTFPHFLHLPSSLC